MTDEFGKVLCTVRVDSDRCDYCLECVRLCPSGALTLDKSVFYHDSTICTYCESCHDVCDHRAITIIGEY